MGKKLTTDELADLITLPGPPEGQLPDEGMRTLEVDEIDLYQDNPRLTRNPAYEEIEASIRAKGVEQPLVVTRPPGGDKYIVCAGGNTRLEIAQRLWRETRDDKYRYVRCIIRPWTSEADVLAAHLRENDLRGNLTLVERALAVDRLRRLLEAERGEPLSQRALVQALAEQGYRVPQTRLPLYRYVVETLYPCIPEALKAGLGIPQAEALRRLDRAFGAAWRLLGIDGGDETAAGEIFRARLERQDPQVDIEALRGDLEGELWTAADDWPAGEISMLLGYLLEGRDEAELAAWIAERGADAEPVDGAAEAAAPDGDAEADGPIPHETPCSTAVEPAPPTPVAAAPEPELEASGEPTADPSPGDATVESAASPPSPEPDVAPTPSGSPATPSDSALAALAELLGDWPLMPTDEDVHTLPPPAVARLQRLDRLSLPALRERAWRLAWRIAEPLQRLYWSEEDDRVVVRRMVLRMPQTGVGYAMAPLDVARLRNHFRRELAEVHSQLEPQLHRCASRDYHRICRQFEVLWGFLAGISEQFRSGVDWAGTTRTSDRANHKLQPNYQMLPNVLMSACTLYDQMTLYTFFRRYEYEQRHQPDHGDFHAEYLHHVRERNEKMLRYAHRSLGYPVPMTELAHLWDWDDLYGRGPDPDDLLALQATAMEICRRPGARGLKAISVRHSEADEIRFNGCEWFGEPGEHL